MRESIAARLLRQTGHDVAWWNQRSAERTGSGEQGGEPELRAWLDGAGVRPTTRTRVDVGLRIDGVGPGGRLLDGSRTAGGSVNLRLPLTSVDELDDEAVGLIGQAYRANQ
jgi:hypothetical protein